MKSALKILGLWLVTSTVGCIAAQAQNCAPWLGVTTWYGSYTITGSGSITDPVGGITTSQAASAKVVLNQGPTQCAGTLVWTGTDSNTSASLDATATDDQSTCGVAHIQGSGPSTLSGPILTINIAAGTYTFSDTAEQDTTNSCGGPPVPFTISPATPIGTPPPGVGPFSNWPWTESLPATTIVLSGTTTFNAPNQILAASIPWTLTWRFSNTPDDDVDDSCKESRRSTIACQNQTFGEDIPVVGTGLFLHYDSARVPGRGNAYGAAMHDAVSDGGWTLNVHHVYDTASKTLFLGNGERRSGWQLGSPVTFNGNTLITPQDGSEVYVFDSTGRHLQTLRPMTGALKYQFGYDSAGNLVTVTDANGNITTIQRSASEVPTAIVSPYSQTTTLGVDINGFLNSITDPAGNTNKFTNGSGGLMTSRTDPNGNTYSYTFDGSGALTNDADLLGGSISLSRSATSTGYSVASTTALGRTTTFQVTTGLAGESFTNTWPDGLQASSTKTQQGSQISDSSTLPDGSSSSATLGPDPVWGIQAPVATSETITQGNLTMNIAGSSTATFGTAGNPFSLSSRTDTTSVNFRTYASNFTASNLTFVNTTPVGRQTTTVLDNQERVASVQIAGLLPTDFSYDSRGRLSTLTQGSRISTFTYDADGRLATATDPLGLQKSFTYDVDGRLLTTTLPDGRVIGYGYDNNGNLTSITPPGESAHSFAYTAVNEVSAYTPPAVSGTGATTYTYNLDRDITKITRPDGNVINYNYDNAGRVSALVTPSETINYSYDPTTGNLSSTDVANGESLTYGYNGPLPASRTWTGAINGTVSLSYNNNFWVSSRSINGSNPIPFTYDNDGLLTEAGSLTLTRSPQNGLITGTTVGGASDSRTYNSFGELTGYTASYGNGHLYHLFYVRDADGRISNKTEIRGFHITTYAYSYDPAGRLIAVNKNGTPISSYGTFDVAGAVRRAHETLDP